MSIDSGQDGLGHNLAQRPLLFRNLDGAKFQEVPPATGSGLAVVIPARGAALVIFSMTVISTLFSIT